MSFACGSLFTDRLVRTERVRANSNRIFELRIYYDLPGKLSVMETRFREKTSKILAKHNLNVVGYWVTTDPSASENAFIFLLAHQSQEEAKEELDCTDSGPEVSRARESRTERKDSREGRSFVRAPDGFFSDEVSALDVLE